MKVAIYSRVSSKDGRQDVENQLAELRAFAARQNWQIVCEYIDKASGKNGDRPAFKRLFADAARGQFELVFFWALDRFSREGTRQTLNYLETLERSGVGYRSLTEPYFDSAGPFKDVVLAVATVLAKQERIRISERTLAGLARARRGGKTLGRPRLVCNRGRIRELRAGGASYGKIAAKFDLPRSTVAKICHEAAG